MSTETPETAKIARDLWQALPRVPEIEDVAALLEEHVYPAIERQVRAKVAEEAREAASEFEKEPPGLPGDATTLRWFAVRVTYRLTRGEQP